MTLVIGIASTLGACLDISMLRQSQTNKLQSFQNAYSEHTSSEEFKKTVSDTPLRLSLVGNVTLFDKRIAIAFRALI